MHENEYKLVAIDLDGTLLNPYGEVPEETRKALLKVKEKGVEVVLASGRPINSTKAIAIELGVDNYLISGNGSVVYDIKNEEILYNKLLTKSQVLEIVRLCEMHSFYYSIYTEDEVIAKSLNYNVLFYHKENIKRTDEKRTHINIVENVENYIENLPNPNFLKVTICDESKIIFGRILEKVKEIKNIDVLEVEYMSKKKIKEGSDNVDIMYYYTEITNKNVNKWSAIEYLKGKLNIVNEEIIAIGDNMNDSDMIKNAGLGVAMGNSNPTVKEIAKVITDDNDSEGVRKILEQYVL